MENNHEIRIYVACLASYNNGILHGRRIDAQQEAWAIYNDIRAMLDASPVAGAEEWAIHDYEGFGGIHLSENEGIDRVAEIAGFLAEHASLGVALVDHYHDIEQARVALEDRYYGSYSSLADYMQEVTECCTEVPEPLRYYIDWQAMARDAEMNGDLFTVQITHDEVHVFGEV